MKQSLVRSLTVVEKKKNPMICFKPYSEEKLQVNWFTRQLLNFKNLLALQLVYAKEDTETAYSFKETHFTAYSTENKALEYNIPAWIVTNALTMLDEREAQRKEEQKLNQIAEGFVEMKKISHAVQKTKDAVDKANFELRSKKTTSSRLSSMF